MATVMNKASRMKGMSSKDRNVNGQKNVHSTRRNMGSQMKSMGSRNPLKGPGV